MRTTKISHQELQIDVGMVTDMGRSRSNNEDWAGYFQPHELESLLSHGRLYLVADGMGGGAAGEVASRYAVDKILRSYYQQSGAEEPLERLANAIAEANADLHEDALRNPDRRTMGTTLVGAVVKGNKLHVVNVGDSRAYLVHNRVITQLTRDHSVVQEMIDRGVISASEARDHPRRNVITRALGAKHQVDADRFEYQLMPGDAVVLCSDGLTTHVEDQTIRDVVLSTGASEAAQRLVQMANAAGGSDNITALVLKVGQWAPAAKVARAARRKPLKVPRPAPPVTERPPVPTGARVGPTPVWLLLLAVVPLVALIAALIVLLRPRVPSIKRIWFEPSQPLAGQPVTVHWVVENAESVEVQPFGIKVDPALGEYTFGGHGGLTGITIIASNESGSTQQALAIRVLVPTDTPQPTDTPLPPPTNTALPPTETAVPTATETLAHTPTETVAPSATNTSPVPTETSVPTPTDTLVPTPTDTLVPTPTDTLVPTPTDTLAPTPTDTLVPTLTDTLLPTLTETLLPTLTDTLLPTPTDTEVPIPTDSVTPAPAHARTCARPPTDTDQHGHAAYRHRPAPAQHLR